MGLLDAAGATLSDALAPFKTIFGSIPDYVGADFDAFDIQEILSSGGADGVRIELVGEWMPHQPFVWGGKQTLVKEYYPGNDEPTVQVLGARETDLKITGRFKVKRLKGDPDTYRTVPKLLCDALDDMRKRGNLVRLTLGDWVRYGFIEDTNWKMKTLADIEYEISFFVIGDKPPSQCKLNDEGLDVPTAENLALIAAAVDLENMAALPFAGMSLGLFAQVQALIGNVATALAVVTKFVDVVVGAAENVEALANRAVGLIKYAQSTVATFKRRVGALSSYANRDLARTWDEATDAKQASYIMKVQLSTSKPPEPSAAQIAASNAKSSTYTPKVSSQQQVDAGNKPGKSIDALLQEMLTKFEKIANSLPVARYLVKSGDTLQQISTRYYKTPDNWKKIYDHNKLTTTVLVAGTVLEIPK